MQALEREMQCLHLVLGTKSLGWGVLRFALSGGGGPGCVIESGGIWCVLNLPDLINWRGDFVEEKFL